ncbi:SDR family oxidoreductase [Nocardia sp. NBC_01377]|uniref:SDR family oxidoreductase n=1 Tax=Nocardia sp. NBC_01377 TaxID=2903595 RepID=UPI00324A5AD5
MNAVKTVAVTGGTRGVGLGIARALLAAGHRVAVCGTDPERIERVRAELPDEALVMAADVTDRDQVQRFWDAGCELLGPIDIWINNAGISHDRERAWALSAVTSQAVVETNLLGAIHGCAVAIAGMAAGGGVHTDAEGSSSDLLGTLLCGEPQTFNVAELDALAIGWADDYLSGTPTSEFYPDESFRRVAAAPGEQILRPY